MNKFLKTLGLIYLLLVSLQSCTKDDVYHNLSKEAKDLLKFEVNETFKLKNLETNEIITLTVKLKKFEFIKDGPNESSFVSFGSANADTYIESGRIQFADVTNCYKGNIDVLANRDGSFKFTIGLLGGSYGCFGSESYYYEFYKEFFPTLSIEGAAYENVYLLNSFPNNIYYSKEKGILKIANDYEPKTLFTFVE